MLVYRKRLHLRGPTRLGGVYSAHQWKSYRDAGKNRAFSGFNEKFSANPVGSLSPNAYTLPIQGGGIVSYTEAEGTISYNVSLIPARNLSANSSITIVVTDAQLDQIVSMAGSGTLTIQKVDAILAGAAALTANGTIQLTSSAASGAIFSVTASSTGQVSVNVSLTALAFMEAEAGGPTPLSPEGLASAVWGATAADNNQAGTMGEKLNDAGSAGNPWAAELTSNNTEGTFGWLAQKLLTVGKFLGLK
jgi:hypothetical protein